jgi:hypothetical protein
MRRHKAEQFEQALHRAAQGEEIEGELASLVEVAHQATVLAESPPPPPQGLLPGRQRFLREANRIRVGKTTRRKEQGRMSRPMKLAAAALAALLLFGLVFGSSQAMADSLPGEAMYSLKLAAEQVRLGLTNAPQSKADLNLAMLEKRIGEVVALAGEGKAADGKAVAQVERQLGAALRAAAEVEGPAASQALGQLATAIQQQQRTMTRIMEESSESEQPLLQRMVRVMNRVREEAHVGQLNPDGLRHRLGNGWLEITTEESGVGNGLGTQQGSGQGDADPNGPAGPPAEDQPGPGPGEPAGPAAEDKPGPGPGESAGPPEEDQPGPGPGEPAGPPEEDQPGPGPGEPAGPPEEDQPGPGPGEPAGPPEEDQPGPGPGEPAGPPEEDQPGPGPGEPAGPNPDSKHDSETDKAKSNNASGAAIGNGKQ